jgi:hypothetical protein
VLHRFDDDFPLNALLARDGVGEAALFMGIPVLDYADAWYQSADAMGALDKNQLMYGTRWGMGPASRAVAQVAEAGPAYGATADQRMKTLAAEAKAAKAGSPQQQTEFTRGLAGRVLEEHDPRVRARIVETAAEFDTPAAAAVCRGCLEDPEPRVRMTACAAWGERGGPEAVKMLSARYHADRDLDVRLRALRELGNLGDGAAIPVLARALEDPDPAVQYRAVAALKKVSGRDLGDDVNKWRAWAADPGSADEPWSIAEAFRTLF